MHHGVYKLARSDSRQSQLRMQVISIDVGHLGLLTWGRYYRAAAGAIVVYDISNSESFEHV